MDLLPGNVLHVITIAFKTLFVVAGGIIVIISYFQSKEARKMEDKLRIALPGSVGLAMSIQLMLSILFLFISTIFLLFL